MLLHRTVLLSMIALVCLLNLTAQNTPLQVYVHDNYTDHPLESVLVSILLNGVVIDSAHTDVNGIATLSGVTSVREAVGLPTSITLSHNYPNPFRDDTNVEIGIPEAQTITATVYNILGQRVASEQLPVAGGYYTLNLLLGHLPTGVYFLRIEGRESQAIKLLKMGRGVHPSGPVFSISGSSFPGGATIGKSAGDEYTVRAVKDRYDVYQAVLEQPLRSGVAIPLARNNRVEFIVIDGNINTVTKELKIELDEYQVIISTPHTLMLKSGNYEVTGEVEEFVELKREIDILSNDTTIVLSYLIDNEKNIYETVKIGDQWWMAENLRATNYRNGSAIPNVPDRFEWNNLSTGAQVYYRNDKSYGVYGRLYNWYAVDDPRGLCPEGWHVSSGSDFSKLRTYLGSYGGNKMKSTRTEPTPHPRWNSNNTGTNESGWSGLPGGLRSSTLVEDFFGVGDAGFWWTTNIRDDNRIFLQMLTSDGGLLYGTSTDDRRSGNSVRCVKDD